jgi:hypothetical protein
MKAKEKKLNILNIRYMKKIIIIVLGLLSLQVSAQEGPGGRPASIGQNSCIVVLNVNDPSCNNIKFCYDASGNRIVRYRQMCAIAWAGNGGGGTGTILAKSIGDTQNIVAQLEATMIFPNPTMGITQIEFDSEIEDGKIDLIDMEGRSISSQSFSGKKTTVDLSKQSAGTYYIIISRQNAKVVKAVVRE